jgi:hypothetical protein
MSLSPQVRFRDLKTAKIIKNHVGLKRLIETQGFPPGKWLGPNTHVWDEAEVEAWLASRPIERPPCADAEPAVEINSAEIVAADDGDTDDSDPDDSDPEPVPKKRQRPPNAQSPKPAKPAKRSAKRTAKRVRR